MQLKNSIGITKLAISVELTEKILICNNEF